MKHETVVATRYVLSPGYEVGSWCGVAYKKDGRQRTELLWGSNDKLAVKISEDRGEDFYFAVHHIFVERYIEQILKLPYNNVEIFRFYLSRGDYPKRPTDLLGEDLPVFKDDEGRDCWTSYEHISGPYYADTQLLASAFSSRRLELVSPEVTHSLISGRVAYLREPQDLPILGIIPEGESTRYYEDLVIRYKTKKPTFVN